VEAGRDRLLDDVLDRRHVDDREHLLRHRFGGREESGSQAGSGNDGFRDGTRHATQRIRPRKLGAVVDVESEKRALRAELRERRRIRTSTQIASDSARLTDRLAALTTDLGVHSLAAYLSLPDEPDTRPFLRWTAEQGLRVLLPISRDDGLLDWAPYDGQEEDADILGMPTPTSELLGPIEQPVVGKALGEGCRRDQHIAAGVGDFAFQDGAVGRVMQAQDAAGQQPGHDRRGEMAEGCWQQRRHHGRALRHAADWPCEPARFHLPAGRFGEYPQQRFIRCQYGVYEMVIDEDGKIYPCQAMQGVFPAASISEVGFDAAFARLAGKPG